MGGSSQGRAAEQSTKKNLFYLQTTAHKAEDNRLSKITEQTSSLSYSSPAASSSSSYSTLAATSPSSAASPSSSSSNSGQIIDDASQANNLLNYYQNYLDKSKDYAMIIFFNLFGAFLLISSFDFISLYLSIELQSFALYILATYYKESRIVTAAGLKYFLLGALSSCFILLGSALIYAFSGLTKFDSIYLLMSSFNPADTHTQFTFGLTLIIIGFLFKIGAAPLHNWAPAKHSG
jgi:NADH:ubiquinone oxidoreductase subunit 2 (subunit N)